MRIVWGVVFGFTAVLLALVFAIVALTKIGSDVWFDYVAIVAFGLGAAGCALAARACLASEARLPFRVEVRVALVGAALVLAALAVRGAVFAATRLHRDSGAVRSIEVVFAVVEALGAAGCVIAARVAPLVPWRRKSGSFGTWLTSWMSTRCWRGSGSGPKR